LSKSQSAYGLENQHASVAGEHVSVDGTLIQACPGHKGFESEDDEDDGVDFYDTQEQHV
jgi:hypothetical protein